MSEPFVITREAWRQLQDQIRSIEEAITGGLDGRSSLRSRVEHLEHDLGSVRANLAALEEGRRWLGRVAAGAFISAGVSIGVALIQMLGKH